MLTAEQIHSTNNFAEMMNNFISRDDIKLFMGRTWDEDVVMSSFYIHGGDNNKHYLGQISFKEGLSDYDYFIDHEVIISLKEKGWL